jgi:O-antigen/teichoic acid export membrane protein
MIQAFKKRVGEWLKTDIDYLLSGGGVLLAGQFSSLFFSFLLSIAFAHYLMAETYGAYKYILSLSGLIWMLSFSGGGTAVTRAVAGGHEGTYIQIFWINLKWNAFVSLICAGIAGYYFFAGNTTLATGLLIAAIFSPVIKSSELYGAFLNGRKEFGYASIAMVLRGFVATTVLFGTLFFAKDPVTLVLAYFIVHACITGTSFFFTIFFMRPNKKTDPEAPRLAKHTSAMNFFSGVADSIDDILVFHYLGAAELALYSFIVLIPNQVASMTKHLTTLATPKFAQREKTLIQENLFRKSFMLFLPLFAIFLVYISSANWIFSTFFPRYMEAVFYSQVYATIMLANGVFSVAFLDSQMAIKQKYIATFTSTAFKFAALILGVIWYGLWGILIARILSKWFSVTLAYIVVKKM